MEVAKRSCGTCRARRIRCDRAIPTCQQCSNSKRKCVGYDIRLFWPNNARRAVVFDPVQAGRAAGPALETRLVHTTCWDVEMHYYLIDSLRNSHKGPTLEIPLMWNPSELDVNGRDLLHYFQCAASQSLTTFTHAPAHLGEVLMRIALAGTTPSATAVLKSLLALASLHRDGVQTQAYQLKISSIRALMALSSHPKTSWGDMEVMQHVAAGMLLCSFEVYQSSCTSGQWTLYIDGVKDVLRAHCVKGTYIKADEHSDLVTLMDWVYYHEVMARFSRRHWRPDANALPDQTADVPNIEVSEAKEPAMLLTESTLDLLSEVCDTVAMPYHCRPTTAKEMEDHKSFQTVLDWRLREAPLLKKAAINSETAKIVGLYYLAMLVYLSRVTDNLLEQAARTQEQIDRAFCLFAEFLSCERQFPLFILGCKARTDEQRDVVLALIARTEKRASSRSLNQVKLIVQAIWAQEDLAVSGSKVGYWDTMTTIISSCSIVPSLV
ncbi:fungal-specific transcription factor domain-containing protein [Cercophora scortea]|uniref:Fungal-specific transcription factor domain-containing protein n=1 Tax=Cercophora scortea TaxID=314031 RepID=A0AAE0IKM2_9PEZI|nr:fungal-specific transcription factor domain-containing protein [Cercophora scortea]